jgi:hypothetical protein
MRDPEHTAALCEAEVVAALHRMNALYIRALAESAPTVGASAKSSMCGESKIGP